jgi:hypothetical protein
VEVVRQDVQLRPIVPWLVVSPNLDGAVTL